MILTVTTCVKQDNLTFTDEYVSALLFGGWSHGNTNLAAVTNIHLFSDDTFYKSRKLRLSKSQAMQQHMQLMQRDSLTFFKVKIFLKL